MIGPMIQRTTMMKSGKTKALLIAAAISLLLTGQLASGQGGQRDGKKSGGAKPVTVPVTIRVKQPTREVEMRFVDLVLKEDGEAQTILAMRKPSENPITLAILIQDDLVSSVSTEARGIANFVRRLPPGSRVMIGYIRTGTLDVRRKFTADLEKAAGSVHPPLGLASASPFNPFIEVIEALRRFDSQPLGRRAIIVVSDGLDISRGADSSSPGQSLDLQRAINEAQRRSVAVYSIYAPSANGSASLLGANGQGCLERLSKETGGRAFFEGTGAPVSFDPFIKEIDTSISMQVALTYLSTHPEKGFHRLEIKPLEREVEIRHPSGYPK
jgi:VWFA-related protein